MTLYKLALFVHMLGLIALFGAMIQYHRAGARLRRARSTEEARVLCELIASGPPWFATGAVLLLASGIYMVATTFHRPPGWVLAGLGGMVLAAIVGARAGARQDREIGHALASCGPALSDEALGAIRNRASWSVITASNGLGLGIVLVMSLKPGLLVSVSLVTAGAVAGALVGASLKGAAVPGAPAASEAESLETAATAPGSATR